MGQDDALEAAMRARNERHAKQAADAETQRLNLQHAKAQFDAKVGIWNTTTVEAISQGVADVLRVIGGKTDLTISHVPSTGGPGVIFGIHKSGSGQYQNKIQFQLTREGAVATRLDKSRTDFAVPQVDIGQVTREWAADVMKRTLLVEMGQP